MSQSKTTCFMVSRSFLSPFDGKYRSATAPLVLFVFKVSLQMIYMVYVPKIFDVLSIKHVWAKRLMIYIAVQLRLFFTGQFSRLFLFFKRIWIPLDVLWLPRMAKCVYVVVFRVPCQNFNLFRWSLHSVFFIMWPASQTLLQMNQYSFLWIEFYRVISLFMFFFQTLRVVLPVFHEYCRLAT